MNEDSYGAKEEAKRHRMSGLDFIFNSVMENLPADSREGSV